ncbi:MAG: hypothetical protein AAGD43_23640 [Pseudomonadota bacterium]
MRTLLAIGLIMTGFAAQAEAQTYGAKAKSKSVKTHSSRSNLGYGKYHNDRQSAEGTRYFYKNYPIWAARAFQPSRER